MTQQLFRRLCITVGILMWIASAITVVYGQAFLSVFFGIMLAELTTFGALIGIAFIMVKIPMAIRNWYDDLPRE